MKRLAKPAEGSITARMQHLARYQPLAVLDHARRLERAIVASGGPPPHLRQKFEAMRTQRQYVEHELAQGMGMVWFLAWPLGAAVAALVAGIGVGGYVAATKVGGVVDAGAQAAKDVVAETGKAAKAMAWIGAAAFGVWLIPKVWPKRLIRSSLKIARERGAYRAARRRRERAG